MSEALELRRSRELQLEACADLEKFVKICDDLGGIGTPACDDFMAHFEFKVDSNSFRDLDPFSDEYYLAQLNLYQELSGRVLDQAVNEYTDFDLEHHVRASNPYANISPSNAAQHLQRLLKLFRCGDLPPGADVLDMGAGWGLSSEICAYIGCNVTALDINPKFIELITRRSARSGLPIDAVHSAFDDFEPDIKYDFISFYECLHHATKPWELISRLSGFLKEGGKIGFAGEPINQIWWPHWGLRLDAVSLYCIRKFGWFESGWSQDFILDCFSRASLSPQVFVDSDATIGTVIIGAK